METSLFDLYPKTTKSEAPESYKTQKPEITGKTFKFLNLFTQNIKHHCILIPNIYSHENCKLLFEFLTVKHQKSQSEIISHPDFLLYTSFSTNQIPIKIEDARNITTFAQNTGLSGNKTIIIEKIDKSTTNALNCLLKIIEEPPQNTIFYLIYEDITTLPLTIKSRCATITEAITNKEDFLEISRFFNIPNPNFQKFITSGYNFNIYNSTNTTFTISQIKQKINEKLDEPTLTQIHIFLEETLHNIATNYPNKINQVYQIIKRSTELQKSINTLNTNKQMALIELVEHIQNII
jgi:hypothetical protein